jgi:hypothetical protein
MEEGWQAGNVETADVRQRLMMEELARDREVKALTDYGSGSIVDQRSWHNYDVNRGFQNDGVHRQSGMARGRLLWRLLPRVLPLLVLVNVPRTDIPRCQLLHECRSA